MRTAYRLIVAASTPLLLAPTLSAQPGGAGDDVNLTRLIVDPSVPSLGAGVQVRFTDDLTFQPDRGLWTGLVTLEGPGIGGGNDEAYVEGTSGMLVPLLREGEPIPGAPVVVLDDIRAVSRLDSGEYVVQYVPAGGAYGVARGPIDALDALFDGSDRFDHIGVDFGFNDPDPFSAESVVEVALDGTVTVHGSTDNTSANGFAFAVLQYPAGQTSPIVRLTGWDATPNAGQRLHAQYGAFNWNPRIASPADGSDLVMFGEAVCVDPGTCAGTDRFGFWAFESTDALATPLLLDGEQAPGLAPGIELKVAEEFPIFNTFLPTGLAAVGADRRVLLVAELTGPGVDPSNETATWIGTPESRDLLFREGLPAPDLGDPTGTGKLQAGFVDVDVRERYLVRADVPGGTDGTLTRYTLVDDASRTPLLSEGDAAPDLSPGFEIGGPLKTFSSFGVGPDAFEHVTAPVRDTSDGSLFDVAWATESSGRQLAMLIEGVAVSPDGTAVVLTEIIRVEKRTHDPQVFEVEARLDDGDPELLLMELVEPCSPVDYAAPRGQLTFADVGAFLNAFDSQMVEADLAEPFGQLTFADVGAFLNLFVAGCP